MPYTAHVLNGFTPLEALEDEWRELFNQAESPNPFFSAEWVYTWLNHRGGRVFPVTLIVRDDDNQLVAAWPFFEYAAIGGRGLWVSLSDIADCTDPLVIRHDPALLDTVFEALGQLFADYRFIWIPLLREQWVRDHLEPALTTFPNLPIIRGRAPNHFIDLAAQPDFDGYLNDTVGAKTRKSLRYDSRQVEQLGQIEFVTYRTPDDLLRFEVEMRSIEKVSWKGRQKVGHLTGIGSGDFFHELLTKLLALGQAEITALRVNQMAIAFEIAVRQPGYYGFFHIAYLPDYHRHSPGKLLMLHNIERAMREDCAEFDFMQGGHEYKQKFCTGTRGLMDAFLCQRSFAGRLNHWLSRLFTRRKAS
ncbi:MAG: GNAT family N-acetyltransferase [Verrucomicrobiota bacterium]|jgi:CelD/BcsL family acetyltransferase involved in cellulose biosynthesis|nr:GNAT family N-acetyltransferase [Verrucomicrobiota bacterium]